ncbi:MAG: glycoside hydrolase family 3 protein [Bacteroidota bacterium]
MASPARRAAQLVMIRADARQWSDADYRRNIERLIDRGVGGVGVFIGALEETADMIEQLQRRGGRRLLIAADYEHGLPMRLDGGIAFPRAMALGRCSVETTEQVASCIAEEARAIGVHWNWAPVADINSNPDNPIVNTRSFGETPEIVSLHAAAYVRGTQAQGLMACAKHVPGHGDTHVDSHRDLPTIELEPQAAEAREFAPFRRCAEEGVRSMMIGHIVAPFLDATHPASLSSSVVTGLVRGAWGYDGLVTTDALDMGAITSRYSSAQAAVMAVKAGCDVVLMPENADEAIRIVGATDLLPITTARHVAAFAIVDDHSVEAATTWFQSIAQGAEVNIDFGYVDLSITPDECASLVEGIAEADLVIFGIFGKAVAFRGQLGQVGRLPDIVRTLSAGRPGVVVACGSPYGIGPEIADAVMYTFSDTLPSIAASVLRLIGRSVPQN